jgi:L-threonylcarbamoyladenylate synthase
MLRWGIDMKDKIIKVDAFRPDSAVIKQAAALINRGEVVVCPTDTGYAFCVNALNPKAIARVFDLKGRSFSNPIHMAVNTIEVAEEYARFSEAARYLAGHYLPGALTIVLPKKEIVPPILVAGLDTVGIRIPDNNVILQLAEVAGKPLTTTSANISRQPAPYSVDEITGRPGINIEKIGLVLDQGVIPSHELSTIVDLSVEPAQLIRQGRISWLEIREVLHGHYNPE